MKKFSLISILLVMAVSVFAGGLEVKSIGSFGGSGAAAAVAVYIDSANGTIKGDALFLDSTTNTTLTISRASKKTTTAVAEVAGTAVSIHVSADDTLAGYTLTTDDYLIIGGVKTKIAVLGAYTAATKQQAITTTDNVTCADNEVVFIVDASEDDITFPVTAAADQSNLRNIFTGNMNMPVHLSLPAAGGTMIVGGTYSVLK